MCITHPGHTYGEIQYLNTDGQMVHSDLCGNMDDREFRAFLHDCLDEFIARAERGENGEHMGVFYIGDPRMAGWIDDPDF